MEQCYICGPSQVQFEDLANAIIIQAADDYRKANPPSPTKNPNAKAFGFSHFTSSLFTVT